jgi:hypothetical protein
MKSRAIKIVLAGAALAVMTVVTSCADKHPTAPQTDLVTLVGTGNVQVMVQQDTRASGDSAIFVVSVVGNGVPVASYQGVLTFDPNALSISQVPTPSGTTGEFRIVNAAEVASGTVRFAGFATEKFSNTEVFRLVGVFKPGKVPVNIVGTLDVAGETTGSSIRASSLKASNALRDLYSGMVVTR